MATITCSDCGETRSNVPKNTRYCVSCRLLRDLAYWTERTRRCIHCGMRFAPIGRNNQLCSTCDPGLPSHRGTCSMRTKTKKGWGPTHEGQRLIPSVPVCAACLRDPRKRPELLAAFRRGQATRRKKNDWKEAA